MTKPTSSLRQTDRPRLQEVALLNYIDDVHLLETQSYGASINYEIAAPLLADLVAALQQAAAGDADAPAARCGAGWGRGGGTVRAACMGGWWGNNANANTTRPLPK